MRPFRVPLFPYFPAIALVIAVIAMVAMSIYNVELMLIFWGLIGFGYVSFRWYQREGVNQHLYNYTVLKQFELFILQRISFQFYGFLKFVHHVQNQNI